MNISKFCKLESKYALSSFLLILIHTSFSLFMSFLNISMETDTKKPHWIFQPSPYSHLAVDLFFPSSSCFFKYIYFTFSCSSFTFFADCLDIILTHLIFPLHLVGHQPPNRCCSIKLWVSKYFSGYDPVALFPFVESHIFQYQTAIFNRHFSKLPSVHICTFLDETSEYIKR